MKTSLPILNQNRTCGGCKACCYTHYVSTETLQGLVTVTPFFQPCKYESRNGCGIYSNRPPQCRGYRCGWLVGLLELDQRPDKTGLVIDFDTLKDGSNIAFVSIMTAWPGAHKSKQARKFIRKLASTQPVVVTDQKEITVMGPASHEREKVVLREYCKTLMEIM